MDNIKCPVCGKPGIPDFHNADVVCPQCKSDLSIYRVIDNIPDVKSERNIWKPISAVSFLVAAVCGLFLFFSPKTYQEISLSNNVSFLNDSIKQLKTEIASLKSASQKRFTYIVRRGDSYWSISKRLYGTGSHAEDIAIANNRTIESPVYVGDTLEIFQ